MSEPTDFLPEDDREYLESKGIKFELQSEIPQNGTARRAVLFPDFAFLGSLHAAGDAGLKPVSKCELLVLIPPAYSTTKLDSFYTFPHLKRADGADPDRATGQESLFGRTRQFWSRHLGDGDWRPGIDGLDTFLRYIRVELAAA